MPRHDLYGDVSHGIKLWVSMHVNQVRGMHHALELFTRNLPGYATGLLWNWCSRRCQHWHAAQTPRAFEPRVAFRWLLCSWCGCQALGSCKHPLMCLSAGAQSKGHNMSIVASTNTMWFPIKAGISSQSTNMLLVFAMIQFFQNIMMTHHALDQTLACS